MSDNKNSYDYINSHNVISYNWCKNIWINKSEFFKYYDISNIIVDITNNDLIDDIIKTNKPILALRNKITSNKLNENYIGLYNSDTIINQIVEISIILYYFILLYYETTYDLGILSIYDWCNTGYRYFRGLKENNVICNFIKIFNHTTFNYGHQCFYVTDSENTINGYFDILKRDVPYYHIKIRNDKLNKLLILFINKCKSIYLHAESYIELNNYDYLNKNIIVGCSGHPYRRDPKNFSRFFNNKINNCLIQCPDLLNLGVINEHLIYYGVDHKHLQYKKTTNNILTIGHYSSSPDTKGSDVIISAINKIVKKYPHKFNFVNELTIADYKNRKHWQKEWTKNILRYRNCDIYIETCKPYLNAYSVFKEYNNTVFGEWGNTCLEAASSGCIVITNSLTKNRYLKDYNYDYPLLIANNESEIISQLEKIYKMSNNEIDELKNKFLKWVEDKHSLYETGKRFKEILLENIVHNMYPSGYLFDTVDFKMKNTYSFHYISMIYLNNKENNLTLEINPNIFLGANLLIGDTNGNLLFNDSFLNLTKLKVYPNLFKSINYQTNTPNHVFYLNLLDKPNNFVVYILFNKDNNYLFDNDNNVNIYKIKNYEKDKNLFLRDINDNVDIVTNLDNKIESKNIENFFNKEHFKMEYKDLRINFNDIEKEKMYILDRMILRNIL